MSQVDELKQDIESFLKDTYGKFNHNASFSEIGAHTLFPAGKLFRPLLTRAVALDYNSFNRDHRYLEAAVEMHHVYTLLHDDLPCMDDDTERRGRPCAHIKFTEWGALLAGDSLLNLSYECLGKMSSPRLGLLLRYFSWSMGPKGLIYGQVKDLSLEMTRSFEDLLETHKLKTSRLIQLALTGSAILCKDTTEKEIKALHRFGESLGITFQLLDDLCELADEEVTDHEQKVNPFFNFPEVSLETTAQRLAAMKRYFEENKAKYLELVLKDYFKKIHSILNSQEKRVKDRISKDKSEKLVEIILTLQSLYSGN